MFNLESKSQKYPGHKIYLQNPFHYCKKKDPIFNYFFLSTYSFQLLKELEILMR